MYWVMVKSVFTAIRGAVVGWGKIERKATVTVKSYKIMKAIAVIPKTQNSVHLVEMNKPSVSRYTRTAAACWSRYFASARAGPTVR